MQSESSSIIMVFNCGSSSLKFSLLDLPSGEELARGCFERLGEAEAGLSVTCRGEKSELTSPGADHHGALGVILEQLRDSFDADLKVDAVGHRVVHGGEKFSGSVLIDDEVLQEIRDLAELAPLHNPANATGIEVARSHFADIPQVAVFDTAFHQTMPPRAFQYAVPERFYRDFAVRRYGFHGTSHAYVAARAAEVLGKSLEQTCLVTAHLGNGCSATAVANGKSVDTSMGLTPLEGLVMGTRSGDVDPSLHSYLAEKTGMSLGEITKLLNKESGLLGLSGIGNDMRTLLEARATGSASAGLAIEVFCYRLAKTILALCAGMPRLDALVFTGGIGENSPDIRAETLQHLRILSPEIDPTRNSGCTRGVMGPITTPESPLTALVVPTNEELRIAQETAQLI